MYNDLEIEEIGDINQYFTNYITDFRMREREPVGATFSTMNYSELNTQKYYNYDNTDTKKEPINNCMQLKYENLKEKEYDNDRRREILDILFEKKVRKWRREREQEKREQERQKLQRREERKEQIKNYRLYYVYRLYDKCFGE